ncbi:hypothetical protein M9H77_05475 [Catharanthus roseus]|uniref:Uncharacterized protein n=1 Tax=Catharanthus roseus TaxID=4058 RepID=A0ACC0CGZ5_CATRO|nr:hypothetical protein M9H77_05475 [Catharanthus roseus]
MSNNHVCEIKGIGNSQNLPTNPQGSRLDWLQKLQPVVALSTTEAEYIAATEAIKEAIWLQDVKYHFIREKVSSGLINIQKISTKDNLADFGTKIVTTDKFSLCRDLLHIDEG